MPHRQWLCIAFYATIFYNRGNMNKVWHHIKNVFTNKDTSYTAESHDGLELEFTQPVSSSDGWVVIGDNEDGYLAVDVFHTPTEIVIRAPIAGVRPEHIDITINNDMVIIRGGRERVDDFGITEYVMRECHWGNFSRTVILPVSVSSHRAIAVFKNGVLLIRLPKAHEQKKSLDITVEEGY